MPGATRRDPASGSLHDRPQPLGDIALSAAALVLIGLVLLTVGAEWLVRGASRLAASLGVAPLIVGLTVVALGTSFPEVVITVGAAIQGNPEVGLGNVLGSNIFNVLCILGVSALIVPLVVSRRVIRIEAPLLVGVSVLVWVLALDGTVSRWEGGALLLLGAGYTFFVVRGARNGPQAADGIEGSGATGPGGASGSAGEGPPAQAPASDLPILRARLRALGLVAAGMVVLALGARWLIDGAVELALVMGVSELVVGLTLVAAGTSFPEVAASILAALRQERDLAVGNIMGSNLYNLFLVVGAGAVLAPEGLEVAPGALAFDVPVMTAVAVACLPIFFTGARIDRWEGGVFLVYYVSYVLFLFLDAADHATVPVMTGVMLGFVTPITVLTILIVLVRELGARRSRTP